MIIQLIWLRWKAKQARIRERKMAEEYNRAEFRLFRMMEARVKAERNLATAEMSQGINAKPNRPSESNVSTTRIP